MRQHNSVVREGKKAFLSSDGSESHDYMPRADTYRDIFTG